MLKQTTALRKIAGLRKKIWCIRGGQGAGKTISILILLINHATSNPNREILILSEELTKMRLTVIKDFVKVMKLVGIYEDRRHIAGTLYRFPNGSFIKFIGLDKEDVGKGLRSHICYFNEGNKIEFETYRQVATRSDRVIIDYNPDAEFWADEHVIPRDDCDFLQLTFEDNELLPDSEREEILNYYKLGYDDLGNVINEYWANLWRVYGLGEIGSLQGAILTDWEIIDEIPASARLLCNGVDFGFSISKFASVDIYRMDNAYYLDEIVYANSLTNPEAAAEMKKNGYKGQIAYCDYAEPKSIKELRDNGIRAVECDNKRDIKDFAIKRLNEKKFYITKRSVNMINEARKWVWDEKTGKPKKSNEDHLMDAICYGIGSEGKYDGRY